ncbi:hypothetical protein ASE06_13240 [Sphingopyxis sp. Root214]|uniref:hypothetical protein n=1 Tax=unclassified Sphingopyxis TaxID=2614943 RepID=UPI0006FAF035|nr:MULTISPECIES: hypothetical protein [unclassified Sphingopyxis]KQZ73351.1 hypothetical protein ASD73_10890 [Sphingopyxis sp. Root154]KRC07497.1 hypothetical protein ASE06_13240 [Sphingopyxis sp. Root214]
MFIGHFAPALIVAARPKAAGLGTLFVAAQLVDVGFAALLIPGIEAMRIVPGIAAMNPMDLYHMPYTHSLLGALIWAKIFGLLVWFATKRKEAAIGAALVVVSHWFIDLIVHIPDLTLYGMPPKLGLGLWNHPLIAMPLEILLIGGAFLYYLRRTEAPGGNRRLWILAGLLAFAQAVDWFGPKEPAYSLAIPATMLFAYALLAGTAAWAGARRRLVVSVHT